MSVRLPVGFAVQCLAGQAWLTQEVRPEDVVLAAGEEFVVQQQGVIVISGIGGEVLIFLSASARQRAGKPLVVTGDLLDAAKARAAELRREEWSRLAGAAWRFVLSIMKRLKRSSPSGSESALGDGLNAMH